jgi:hypothetical protein
VIEKFALVPYLEGNGIDLNGPLPLPFGHVVRLGVRQLPVIENGSLDFVLVRTAVAPSELEQAAQKLKVGGRLVVFMPVKEGFNIPKALPCGWDWVEHEEDEKNFFQVFVRRGDEIDREAFAKRPEKSAGVFRIGFGYGDALWASSICAHLKEQGYAVTVYAGRQGAEILRTDPNVDRVVVLAGTMLRTEELAGFWVHESARHDRWINCFGVVEGPLLFKEDVQIMWPEKLRRRMAGHNYLEVYHDLAELPYDFRVRFYPTEMERAYARSVRAGEKRLVALIDTGSHLSKWWPHMGELALELAKDPDTHVAVLGAVKTKFPRA